MKTIYCILCFVFSISISYAKMNPYIAGIVTSAGGGGTVSYVGAEQNNNNSNSIVVTVPAGTSDGDYMLACATSDSDEDISFSGADFTEIASVTSSSSRTECAERTASSEPANYTFTKTASDGFAAGIIVFEKTSGTWSEVDTTSNAQGTTTSTSTAVDTQNNSALFIWFGNDDVASYDTEPATMTRVIDVSASSTARSAGYYELYATGESSVTETFIWDNSGDVSCVAVALEAQ